MTTHPADGDAAPYAPTDPEDPAASTAVLVGVLIGLVSAVVPLVYLQLILTVGDAVGPAPSTTELAVNLVLVVVGFVGEISFLIAAWRLERTGQRGPRWAFALTAPALPWTGMVVAFSASASFFA